LDASRAVVVVNNLLDPQNKGEYMDDIKKEYEDVRREYYETQRDRKYVSLAKARAKKPKVEWSRVSIHRPSFLGPKVFVEYDL
jgi:5-methyltetrahydrofolate--homocysteine methyltransferase